MTETSRWRFILLIGGSVSVALLLVAVSIALYFSSGTAQLDLSRPGYKSVRSQSKEDPYTGFSSSGSIDEQALNDFQKLYQEQANKATSLEPFTGDALNDSTLGIDDSAVATSPQ